MTTVAPAPRRLGATMRRDRWWIQPLAIFTALTLLGVYAIVVAAMNKDFLYLKHGAKLLSPLYSPDLSALFGWHNGKFPYAFLVLWSPLGMRATCYYYRKSYYRSFFLSPPSCAVQGRPQRKRSDQPSSYTGETKLPLVLNNLHRFLFYIVLIVVGFLTYDVVRAFIYKTPSGTHFGVSVGAFVMLANLIAIYGFTFGCNSWRHLIGGGMNCWSCSLSARARHGAWKRFSLLNYGHAKWAWVSLFSVMFTDFYIRLVAGGIFTDPHHIF